ncbi:MAG: ankyrin repeat domain-containing protein [Candidatus Delongbacteria bacterium]|nr:ankyrin repeat domain-containing protein [Candidatus Delongbacteria bacterium]
MNNTAKELSIRYYVVEGTIWTLSLVLIISRFLGLAPDQELPVLDITLKNSQNYSLAVALMLIATLFYMVFEWKYSSHDAKSSFPNGIRLMITKLVAIISLLISYPVIVQNTDFANVSRLWFLGFLTIGLLLGGIVSTLAFTTLMIRSLQASKQLQLPRIPAVTRALYISLIPLFLILLFLYYLLIYFSPQIFNQIAVILVLLPFFFMLAGEFASLFFAIDEKGKRIPYSMRISQLREIVDFHDYAYHLIYKGEDLAQDLSLPAGSTPQDIQMEIKKKFAVSETRVPMNFQVKQLEKVEFKFYPKDGSSDNSNPQNCGVKVRKYKGKGKNFRVLFIPDDKDYTSMELSISTSAVEKYAEEYIRNHPSEEPNIQKIFSYALNTAVINSFAEESGPILHRLVQSGMEKEVVEAIKNHADVNEKAEAGWTPLLYAVAQGYPKIVSILLDAGANPEISNVNKITPLMYSARYGNTEICKILLDHEVDLDTQDIYGMTALIVAARDGHKEIVELLLKAGADTEIETREGKKAVDFAYERGNGQIAKLLKKAKKKN